VSNFYIARNDENPTNELDLSWNQPEGYGIDFSVRKIKLLQLLLYKIKLIKE